MRQYILVCNLTACGFASKCVTPLSCLCALVKTLTCDFPLERPNFETFRTISVTAELKPRLAGILCSRINVQVLFVFFFSSWGSNSGSMFFVQWTSKPQVCPNHPSFNHAPALPITNEKQAMSVESGEKQICSSIVHTSLIIGAMYQQTLLF